MFLSLNNTALIKHLQAAGVLRSPKIREALEKFPREDFVPTELRDSAYEDCPLPIGEGQTISQPYTIVFMLEQLDVREGDNVLEIGAGSGWQTALLSYLVNLLLSEEGVGRRPAEALAKAGGGAGQVWAYEINPTVAEFGKKNLARFNLSNVHYLVGDAMRRAVNHAPYDRIIAGAAFAEIPKDLVKLLKIGGRLAAPTQIGAVGDVRLIIRESEKGAAETIYPGFTFVPITHK